MARFKKLPTIDQLRKITESINNSPVKLADILKKSKVYFRIGNGEEGGKYTEDQIKEKIFGYLRRLFFPDSFEVYQALYDDADRKKLVSVLDEYTKNELKDIDAALAKYFEYTDGIWDKSETITIKNEFGDKWREDFQDEFFTTNRDLPDEAVKQFIEWREDYAGVKLEDRR